jgi:hypothetical protein
VHFRKSSVAMMTTRSSMAARFLPLYVPHSSTQEGGHLLGTSLRAHERTVNAMDELS